MFSFRTPTNATTHTRAKLETKRQGRDFSMALYWVRLTRNFVIYHFQNSTGYNQQGGQSERQTGIQKNLGTFGQKVSL